MKGRSTTARMKEPILLVEQSLESLRMFKQALQELEIKEFIEKFSKRRCERDVPYAPNAVMPPRRNNVILKELSDLVTHYKVFELKLREAIDIPLKMMQIFRIAKVVLLYSTKG